MACIGHSVPMIPQQEWEGTLLAIVGSSNFTISGISHNIELNAHAPGDENHAALSQWFDTLWDEMIDFDQVALYFLYNISSLHGEKVIHSPILHNLKYTHVRNY
jgi:hypothetical protein